MKSRMLMAALVVVMLMGVRAYAHDCGPCCEVDPCSACNTCVKPIDLFSGLKRLVASRPSLVSECGPCDAIVACTPCEPICDPCGDAGCDDGCRSKFVFGSRLRAFFAAKGCNPCDAVECSPCDTVCNPCDDVCGPCDDPCGPRPGFSFRKMFKGFARLNSCSCGDGCNPCDVVCDPCGEAGCDPCGEVGCDPCGEVGCDPCGTRFGRLFDRPRFAVKKFFDGFRFSKCNPCNPCDPCGPCEPCVDPCVTACGCIGAHGNGEAAAPASQLPEAAK